MLIEKQFNYYVGILTTSFAIFLAADVITGGQILVYLHRFFTLQLCKIFGSTCCCPFRYLTSLMNSCINIG
jgi:hypothetical protein